MLENVLNEIGTPFAMSQNNGNPIPEFNKEDFMAAFFNPDVPFNYKFLFIAAALIYTISPIDILPELLGPIGLADDVGIWVIGAQLFTHMANRALKEQHIEEHTDSHPDTIVVDAQSAPAERVAPPTQKPPGQQPRLPASHLQRHHPQQAPDPKPTPYQPVLETDALTDEEHEQLILQKHNLSREEFEKLMQKTEEQARQNDNWDFSRNDPFSRKRDKKS